MKVPHFPHREIKVDYYDFDLRAILNRYLSRIEVSIRTFAFGVEGIAAARMVS